jgi:hypothetical protein
MDDKPLEEKLELLEPYTKKYIKELKKTDWIMLR